MNRTSILVAAAALACSGAALAQATGGGYTTGPGGPGYGANAGQGPGTGQGLGTPNGATGTERSAGFTTGDAERNKSVGRQGRAAQSAPAYERRPPTEDPNRKPGSSAPSRRSDARSTSAGGGSGMQ